MALPIDTLRRPVFMLAKAEAFLTIANALIKSWSKCLPVMWKFSSARIVCTP